MGFSKNSPKNVVPSNRGQFQETRKIPNEQSNFTIK